MTPNRRRVRASRPRAETRSQKAAIYGALKDRIVFAEWKPGEAVNETRLAGDLGVSRTLLREVLHRLVTEGLLAAVPGQGIYVESVDLLQLTALFELRAPLEQLAGRLAAERARREHLDELRELLTRGDVALAARDFRELTRLDWRFHELVGEAARNPRLAQCLLQALGPFTRLWYVAMSEFGQIGDPVGDWRRVLGALDQRSAEGAASALLQHMNMTPGVLLPVLSSAGRPLPFQAIGFAGIGPERSDRDA